MKKNTFKIILDAVMALVLMFMYKKSVLGLTFHELAGVGVCLLFIVHILLNRKWVTAATKALFTKGTPGKVRACYIVDLLIALSFLGLLITGLGISKIVFKPIAFLGNAGNPWHFMFGGLSLILLGVHLGLHWDWIKASVLKFYAKAPKAVHAILTAVAACFSGFGVYALATSSVGRWLKAPFTSGGSPYAGAAGHGAPTGTGAVQGAGQAVANAAGQMVAGGAGGMPAGGPGAHGAQPITASSIISTFFIFLAIVVLVAFVTVIVEWLATRKQKKAAAEKVAAAQAN